ncbi:MAG: hypothetical protein ACQEXJ_00335 [Myxococcota bacterium]
MVRLAAPLLATLLLASPAAEAKDMNGKLGLGLEQSLGGVSGLTVRYWPGAAFGLMSTLGVDVTSVKEEDDSTSLATTVVSSVGFRYNFARSLHANLGTGARLAIGYRSERAARLIDPEHEGRVIQFIVEIPLALDFFLSDSFSVGVATGLLFVFVPDEGAALTPVGHGSTTAADTFSLGIGAGSITGTLSAVYYF